jgi:hypothetical protein
MSSVDFPGITKQARGIAKLYKWLGLYSIPVLTIVTIISISNVFVRGQLATWSWLEFVWAIVFAAAIEVNIVRLFFEAKLDNDKGAFVLGIVLAIVAGAALLIEGLQQSIGFDWNNIYVQWTVGIVVMLRVFVVVLLLAREGSKLASAVHQDTQPMYACLVQFDAPALPEDVQIEQEVEQQLHIVHAQQSAQNKRTLPPAQIRKMRTILNTDPTISVRKLAQQAGVSPSTAQNYKSSLAKEA